MKENNSWYTMTVEDVLSQIGSTKKGLSQQAAEERLEQVGQNELKAGKSTPPLAILVEQFKNILSSSCSWRRVFRLSWTMGSNLWPLP
jgi:magnesium-transporting ATPase (P-type)